MSATLAALDGFRHCCVNKPCQKHDRHMTWVPQDKEACGQELRRARVLSGWGWLDAFDTGEFGQHGVAHVGVA